MVVNEMDKTFKKYKISDEYLGFRWVLDMGWVWVKSAQTRPNT